MVSGSVSSSAISGSVGLGTQLLFPTTGGISGGGITGTINGTPSVTFSASLSATVPLLKNSAISWSATDTFSYGGGGWTDGGFNLTAPSVPQIVGDLLGSQVSSLAKIPILGPLANTLEQPLPLINESIAQLTGLDSKLPDLRGFNAPTRTTAGSLTTTNTVAGGTLSTHFTSTTIFDLLSGQSVDLFSWSTGEQTINLANYHFTIPIFSLGVPGVVSAEIDATFGVDAALNYDVGFGYNTKKGFYIQAGTPSSPNLGLSFSVDAGLQGQVEVFGFPLAEAGGDVGFSISPYVTLTPPPSTWTGTPAPEAGRVYLSQLAAFGSDPFTDLADDLSTASRAPSSEICTRPSTCSCSTSASAGAFPSRFSTTSASPPGRRPGATVASS